MAYLGTKPANAVVISEQIADGAVTPPKLSNDAAMPPGAIQFFARPTVPSGWLAADGSAVSRATYAELFDALVTSAGFTSQTFTVTIASPAVFTKTAHGFTGGERIRLSTTGALPTGLNTTTDYFVIFVSANTFRVSTTLDGSAVNTSGSQSGTHSYLQSLYGLGDGSTTFNLPDLGGHFARGWVSGQAIDDGRSIGSMQMDAMQGHIHRLVSQEGTASGIQADTNILFATGSSGQVYNTGSPLTDGTNGTPRTAAETRPRNISLLACIKY